MDFVVGTGRIFGVRLPENFRQPFFSRTASEFWQRWHITLGTWFRDYVFYPVSLSKPVKRLTTSARHLLGNRMGPVAASGVALLAVWLGNGLWHGAGGQYVLFGLFWFAVIWLGGFAEPIAQSICERLGIDRSALPYRAFQHARTLAIVFCGELIFRADGGWAALGMLRRLFGQFSLASFADGTVLKLGMDGADFACVGIALRRWSAEGARPARPCRLRHPGRTRGHAGGSHREHRSHPLRPRLVAELQRALGTWLRSHPCHRGVRRLWNGLCSRRPHVRIVLASISTGRQQVPPGTTAADRRSHVS